MATKVLAVSGPVIVPGDPAYDAARAVFIGGVDRRPSAIVRAASAEDVARVVTYARETDSELAIRCGGHSAAGHGTTDGGIILDLRELRSLEIDAAGRNAWAGAGLTAIEYTKATAAHGLATGFGVTGSTRSTSPSSSGRSVVAEGTSVWPRVSSSGFIRSTRSSVGCCSYPRRPRRCGGFSSSREPRRERTPFFPTSFPR